ncbi:DUF7289 family protein [Halovenus marina]|uniref:DUF7289 family protein n=1 Tax=Halovenus marina TaxID=3396621 RepID=UPI003F55DF19
MVGAIQRGDKRGVSEILGTTFVISLSLLSALAVIALGTVTIQGVTDHSTDSVGQQSIEEMQQRLSGLSEHSFESSTTFEFPGRTGDDVQMDPDEGVVRVEVENAAGDTAQTQFDLGTITHETSDGRTLIFQGGALFVQSAPGSARLISEPSFDFADGQLDLSLMQIDSTDQLREREQITAERLAAESRELSEDIRTDLASVWEITSDGTQYGVEPVDITVTFETEYYRGWKAYASNYMTDSPTTTSVDQNQNTFTMKFDNVGKNSNLITEINNFNSVVYSGHAQYAKLHNDIDDEGDQKLRIDRGDTVAVYDNPSGPGVEGPWAIHESGNNWKYYPAPGGGNIKSSQLSDFDYNNNDIGTYADDLPICVVNGDTGDMEDAIDDGDCVEQMLGVSDPGSLDPTSDFVISNVNVDTSTKTVTADITNEGYIDDEQYVTLVDVNSGAVVDYSNSAAGQPLQLDVGDTKQVSLSWNDGAAPPNSELTGLGTIRIETETDAVTSTKPSRTHSLNSDFALDIDFPSSVPEYGESVSVDIDLENQGSDQDTQTVALKLDGSTVDLKTVTLSGTAGPNPTRSITLDAELRGVSRTAELTVSTDDDTESQAILVDPEPLPDPEMRLYQNPISVSVDTVQIHD